VVQKEKKMVERLEVSDVLSATGQYIQDEHGNQSRLSLIKDGNVGIGTTNPELKLEVNDNVTGATEGGILISQNSTLNTDKYNQLWGRRYNNNKIPLMYGYNRSNFDAVIIGGGFSGVANATIIALYTGAYGETTGYERLRIAENGNIGIATSSPASLFDVNAKFNVLSGGNVGIGTTSPSSLFDVNAKFNVLSSGNVGIGTTNPSSLFDVNAKFNVLSGGNVGIGTTNPSSLFDVNAKFNVLSGGNVGIGTTNPGYKLDVDGDINISESHHFLENGSAIGNGFWTQAGSNDVYYNKSGNVGIGTNNPLAKVHIESASTSDTVLQIDASNTSGNIVNIADEFIIQYNGFVGIGTSGVDSSLVVMHGMKVKSTTNNYLFNIDGVNGDYVGIGTHGNFMDSRLIIKSKNTESDEFVLRAQNSDDEDLIAICNDGNIGIGTTDPASLQINTSLPNETARGVENVRIGVYSGTPRIYFEDYGYEQFGIDNDAGRFRIFKKPLGDGVELMTIKGSGNVGIGTSEPGTLLAINGLTGTSSGNYLRIYNNNVYYDSSSLRLKENIQPFKEDFTKIFKLEPKTYIDKNAGLPNIGYIAEELDELGLKNLVIYNTNGQPDGIQYDKITLYLIEIIKDQQERLENLETKLN
jgi:hypothetical protein